MLGSDCMQDCLERAPGHVPVRGSYDVVVAGGGPSGFMAATAAARSGARTLLVERYGFLGGTATAGLMVEFGSIHNGQKVIVGGIPHEFLHRLMDYGGTCMGGRDPETHAMTFDPESMVAVCQEMVLESGADVLLHAWAAGPLARDGRVEGLVLESKSGREAVHARVVIDCTGDADLAVRAGARYEYGRETDGRVQPATLVFVVGNVDYTRTKPVPLNELIAEARARGEWDIPADQFFSCDRVCKRGAPDDLTRAFMFVNVTNVLNVNGTSVDDRTRAEIEARRQVETVLRFMRKYMPGFEHCYVDRVAPEVGIRETRRIVGDYRLTRDDVLCSRHFPDGVTPSCQTIDVHELDGKTFAHEHVERGTHYEIPYRCFLPQGLEGILVAGRSISCDHAALGSVRRMCVCMPMGEACGLAATLAIRSRCTPREIDVQELRKALRDVGTVLDS